LTILILAACQPSEKVNVQIKERPRFAKAEAEPLFNNLLSKPQTVKLTNNRDTAITYQKGTVISIPQNAFVDKSGKTVEGEVTIEVVEALDISDFLSNNLQTISDGQLLESAGMIYINASANGEPLALAENTSLQIELPSNQEKNDFQVFQANYDENGEINWTAPTEIESTMIPLPLEELGLKYYKTISWNSATLMDVLDWNLTDTLRIDNSHFSNSYLATEEFEKRLLALKPEYWFWRIKHDEFLDNYANGTLSASQKSDIYWSAFWPVEPKQPKGSGQLYCKPLDIYLQNTDKPLFYADSLVVDHLLNKWVKDSVRFEKGQNVYGNDLFAYLDRDYYGLGLIMEYQKAKKAFPKPYDPRGVDMSSANARAQLMEKGYTSEEAYEQVLIHQQRERIIKRRRDRKRAIEEQRHAEARTRKLFSSIFKVQKLGWVNLDRFYNDPNAEEVVLFVETKSEVDSLDYTSVTMVIPSLSVAVNAHLMENGKYRFTKDSEMYRKLPIGANAILVAMANKGNQPYFTIQPFKIEKKQEIVLELEASTWDGLKKGLGTLDM
jgi:hypothetical protein